MIYWDPIFTIAATATIVGGCLVALGELIHGRHLRRQHHTQLQLLHNIPVGLCYDYKGQILTVIPHHSSDFKSLFDELPLHIEEKYKLEDRGVFPSAVSIIANLSANEVLKYLLNIGELLIDTLLVVDTLKNNYEKIKLK